MKRASVSVVALSGELDFTRRAEIRTQLTLKGDEQAVLLDCADVSYADSTAISELLRFARDAEQARVPIAILIADRRFARLLQYAGVANFFSVFESRAAALAFLGSAGRE